MAQLIVVTPNPAVDVTYDVPAYEPGSSVRVSGVSRRPGGKGLNVVRVLRALGEPAVAVLPLGGAAGRWVSSAVDAEGLAGEVVAVAGETRTTVAIVDPVGHPTLFNEPGPELTAAEGLAVIAAAVKHCEPGSVVVVSGSLPRGIGPAWLGELVGAVKAAGARVAVDTSGPALVAAAEAGADLLKPNAQELLDATGETTLEGAVSRLQAAGASIIVVSQGADGLIAFAPEGTRTRQAAVKGVTGNPTGAGDAATAGLAQAWARGEPVQEMLRQAAVLGAAAVRQPVAGEVDPKDVEAFRELLKED
ncbi:1-phosphofructokinase family hexose kinase [Kineosporia succinea]|uniref:1-phosphofructokinase family hexose kinase n=1 Tax=Kineosporia succinea TaxID=84632 RepID=A0ABT9NVP2_9ACTN|nr:hexose kinase [Kineosporia succinea]MDP9824486.1 1-phosphofructokinase family hexose kinase [Kineosporia succinea]